MASHLPSYFSRHWHTTEGESGDGYSRIRHPRRLMKTLSWVWNESIIDWADEIMKRVIESRILCFRCEGKEGTGHDYGSVVSWWCVFIVVSSSTSADGKECFLSAAGEYQIILPIFCLLVLWTGSKPIASGVIPPGLDDWAEPPTHFGSPGALPFRCSPPCERSGYYATSLSTGTVRYHRDGIAWHCTEQGSLAWIVAYYGWGCFKWLKRSGFEGPAAPSREHSRPRGAIGDAEACEIYL
jgi:hypothetical protein